MDIKKVQELVESSKMTDEAKDLIYKMLPNAEKEEVKEEIMKVIDFEIDMNQALADEAEEIIDTLDNGEKMMVAADEVAAEQLEELNNKAEEKYAELDKEKEEIDAEIQQMTSDEGPTDVAEPEPEVAATPTMPAMPAVEEPVTEESSELELPEASEPELPEAPEPAPAQPVQFVPQWNQPVIQQPAEPVAPVAPFEPAPIASSQPVSAWNQPVTETPAETPATQPAPFPGNQVGQ